MSSRSDADFERNRAFWDAHSADYQERHAEFIAQTAWGVWRIPESELQVLGDVAGKDVLEYGCGAGQWSIELAKAGARVVGLDNSAKQLEFARRLQAEQGVEFPLVHSPAEETPLPDASFDVVFCDHGAMSFADPIRTVPEAARLLRPGGLLAFCIGGVLREVTWDYAADRESDRLLRPYFGLHRIEDADGSISYNLPHGDWIRLFRASGFVVEDLIELQAPENAETTYGWDPEWARRWPGEVIWKARRT